MLYNHHQAYYYDYNEVITFVTTFTTDIGGGPFFSSNYSLARSSTVVQMTMLTSSNTTNLNGVTFLSSNSLLPFRYRPLYIDQTFPIRVADGGTNQWGMIIIKTTGSILIFATPSGGTAFSNGVNSGFYATSLVWNVTP